jgi:anti-anti-sigma regulatory factor
MQLMAPPTDGVSKFRLQPVRDYADRSFVKRAFAGEWSIGNAGELRQFLSGYLEMGPEVALDLAGVQACDTAALQLICSFRRSALERGVHLRIAAWPPAIVELAGALGLPLEELREGGGDGV